MHRRAYKIPAMIFMGSVALLGGSVIAMLLWNALMPQIFHLPALTYWQTIGLLLLSRLIFGFGCHGGHGHRGRGFGGWGRNFDHLSPEEKERIFHRMWDDDCCSPRGWHKDRPSEDPKPQE